MACWLVYNVRISYMLINISLAPSFSAPSQSRTALQLPAASPALCQGGSAPICRLASCAEGSAGPGHGPNPPQPRAALPVPPMPSAHGCLLASSTELHLSTVCVHPWGLQGEGGTFLQQQNCHQIAANLLRGTHSYSAPNPCLSPAEICLYPHLLLCSTSQAAVVSWGGFPNAGLLRTMLTHVCSLLMFCNVLLNCNCNCGTVPFFSSPILEHIACSRHHAGALSARPAACSRVVCKEGLLSKCPSDHLCQRATALTRDGQLCSSSYDLPQIFQLSAQEPNISATAEHTEGKRRHMAII